MQSSQSTDALVALEDTQPEILFEVSQLAPVSLWALARMTLARTAANNELGTVTAPRHSPRFGYQRSLAFDLVLPHPRSSSRIPANTSTLFIVNGKTMSSTPTGIHNWLVEDFAAHAPLPAAILQDQSFPRFPARTKQPTFASTYFEKDLALRVGLKSRRVDIPSAAEDQIRRFTGEVLAHFDYPVPPDTSRRLIAALLAASRRLHAYQDVYSRFLDRVQPELIIMGNASYTNRPALFPLLRERGIPVYEPQHGWIGPSHAAYNFGAAFSRPELKTYLPDVLLTFGEFWSGQIRHPALTVAIGKPALERAVAQARNTVTTQDRILLISSIFQPEELTRLALLLRERLPADIRIAVRPHPAERPIAEQTFATMLAVDGIELDQETDLYRSFARARAVVGYSSTVLFEALPFSIPAYVIDSPLADLYTPRDVFGERLSVDGSSADRVVRGALRNDDHRAIESDSIWKPNAIYNFATFLDTMREGHAPDSP